MPEARTTDQVDSHVEHARREIRDIAREISELAESDLTPEQFYPGFLQRAVTALAAYGGAIWILDDRDRVRLEFQINLDATRLTESEENLAAHTLLLQQNLQDGRSEVVQAHSGAGDTGHAGNPTDFLLVLAPFDAHGTRGVVEVFQRPDSPSASQRGYLRFLEQISQVVTQYLKNHSLRQLAGQQTSWAQLDQFARAIHQGLDLRTTAYAIANEGRRVIQCDRVSVVVRRAGRYVVEAVSGQDVVEKRSNAVWLLRRLAATVGAIGERLWYTGDTSALAPEIEESVHAFVDETHSKTVGVLPLRAAPPSGDNDSSNNEDHREGEVIGALVIEQINDVSSEESLSHGLEPVAVHAATALDNVLAHSRVPFSSLGRLMSKSRWLVSARNWPKTAVISGILLAALIALFVVPADLELEGRGTLQPVRRRHVFAVVDGVVSKVHAKHGQQVNRGELLLELRNTDLQVGMADLVGRHKSTREQMLAVQRSLLDRRNLSDQEQDGLSGQLLELREKLESLTQQLELYEQKEKQLQVASPEAGQVVTWEPEDLLMHRPVSRGQVLLTVADPHGPWELEIQMPEDYIGHISKAQAELKKALPVQYVMATQPGDTFEGAIDEVHSIAEVRGEEGNTVLVRVAINKQDLTELRPGVAVTAKVYCGRRSLGYVWFHDLIAFVQSKILFRF